MNGRTAADANGAGGPELVLRELTGRATTDQLLQFLAPQAPFVSSQVGKLFGTLALGVTYWLVRQCNDP